MTHKNSLIFDDRSFSISFPVMGINNKLKSKTKTPMPIDKVLGKLLNTKFFVFTSGEIPNAKIITNTEPGHNKPDQYEFF